MRKREITVINREKGRDVPSKGEERGRGVYGEVGEGWWGTGRGKTGVIVFTQGGNKEREKSHLKKEAGRGSRGGEGGVGGNGTPWPSGEYQGKKGRLDG